MPYAFRVAQVQHAIVTSPSPLATLALFRERARGLRRSGYAPDRSRASAYARACTRAVKVIVLDMAEPLAIACPADDAACAA